METNGWIRHVGKGREYVDWSLIYCYPLPSFPFPSSPPSSSSLVHCIDGGANGIRWWVMGNERKEEIGRKGFIIGV